MISFIKKLFKAPVVKVLMKITGVVLLCSAGSALADSPTAIAMSNISNQVSGTVSEVAVILSDIALIVGICFILTSFFKFHQYKQNPQQVQVSQGVTLLVIGAALCLFPTMLPTATQAAFGTAGASINQVGGGEINSLIGGGGSSE